APGGWGVGGPAEDPGAVPSAGRERKIAAIGVRVAAGTTMHGFAINVEPDLASYDKIIPCGLVGVGVTSMAAELGRPVVVAEVAAALRPELERLLTFAPYVQSGDIGSGRGRGPRRLMRGPPARRAPGG